AASTFAFSGCGNDDSSSSPPFSAVDSGSDGDAHSIADSPAIEVPAALRGSFAVTFDPASVFRLDIGASESFLISPDVVGNEHFTSAKIIDGFFYLITSDGKALRCQLTADGSAFAGPTDFELAPGGSFTATIGPDRTPPIVKIAAISDESAPLLLPWDAIHFTSSEPVDPNAFLSSITSDFAGASIDVDTDSSFDFGRSSTASLAASNWTQIVGKSATVTIGAIHDPSGNASLPASASKSFAKVPSAAVYDFLGGADSVSAWDPLSTGSIGFLGGAVANSSCETGSCAELGRFDHADQVCLLPNVGFAGIITSSTALANLHVRYRILARTNDATPINHQSNELAITAATPTQIVKSVAGFQTTDLTSTNELGMTMTTPWKTLTVPLPASSKIAGFAIHTGSVCEQGSDVPSSGTNSTIILISSVTAN
ncbi:MAG: hypothetical protein ABI461_16750, partial [Polyangiaceae bacterium]